MIATQHGWADLIIVYQGQCYRAGVVDKDYKGEPKRVRIQNDIMLQDKVLMPSQYNIKGLADED